MYLFPLSVSMKNKLQSLFYPILVLLFLYGNAFSQNYTFQKLYGDSAFDGLTIVQCADKSFLYAGSKYIGAGDYDLIVMKTTSDGEILWSKTYSVSDSMLYPIQIVLCRNDEFAIAAIYDRTGEINERDFCIIRFDDSGNIKWSKLYGGDDFDDPRSLVSLPDNGFVGLGYTNSFGSSSDIFLFKLDSAGNYVWSKEFGDQNIDEWSSELKVLTDGSIIVFGQSDINSIAIAKFESGGNVIWSRLFEFTTQIIPWSMDVSYDKAIFVLGVWAETMLPNTISPFLIKFDSTGNLLWHKHYLSNDFYGAGSSKVKATRDLGAIINLSIQALISNSSNAGLLKVDKDGEVQWAKAYSIHQGEYPRDLITTSDGGYAVSGFGMYWKAFFLKTDEYGTTGCHDSSLSFFTIDTATTGQSSFGILSEGGNVNDVTLSELNNSLNTDTLCENEIAPNSVNDPYDNNHINVYPNPAKEMLIIESKKNMEEVSFINILGQEIFSIVCGNARRIEISVEHIPFGIYHLRVKTSNGYKVLPFVKE